MHRTKPEESIVQANERGIDRLIRAATGAVMLIVAVISFSGPFAVIEGTIALALGIIGAVSLLTGLMGWCPFYAMLGITTCETRARHPR